MEIGVKYRHYIEPPKGIKRINTYVAKCDNGKYCVINDFNEELEFDLQLLKNLFIPFGNTWDNVKFEDIKKEETIKPTIEKLVNNTNGIK